MDKDESYENVQEAEENFAYELEMQQQEEEQEDKTYFKSIITISNRIEKT